MFMIHSSRRALPLLALCGPLLATAGRPLQAEDAGLLEPGQCEAEASGGRQRSADGVRTRDQALGLGCALGPGAQAGLGFGRSTEAGDPALRAHGLDIGLKLDARPLLGHDGWALAVAAGWAREPGRAWRHAVTSVTLAGSPALAPGWTAHLNLGHEHDAMARQVRTTWALALEHEGRAGVAPMAELFGDDREAPSWNLGLRWEAVPQRLWLDAAYGRQIRVGRPLAISVSVSVGAKLQF
jgi:hypothetical protein